MTPNKISWQISIGNNLNSQIIELPFRSRGSNNMKQAEAELSEYMSKNHPGQTYSIMYWDWIDPENKQVKCKVCGTWYGSVWDKKGGCPKCQENKAREQRKQQEKEWILQEREKNRQRKFSWWGQRKK